MMTEPNWLTHARTYLGTAEIPGKQTAPTIARWLRELKSLWSDDETPWCGTFVASMFRETDKGIALPKNWFRARAWLDWGVPLHKPAQGCVVVYERGGGGHVGFVVGTDVLGRVMTLGGNQGNRVSIAPFERLRVLGYRWPAERFMELGASGEPPLLKSSGPASMGEA